MNCFEPDPDNAGVGMYKVSIFYNVIYAHTPLQVGEVFYYKEVND